jgi:hypothetical protein
MFSTILLISFTTNGIAAWSGILMDGDGSGQTQLYVPGNPPINTPNVNFGLPHRWAQAVVMLNGKAYFTGGAFGTNAVTIFDPTTNKSTSGMPMNVGRWRHGATVVGDTIIVCGGNGPCGDTCTTLSSCEQYTPSTQKWNVFPSLPAQIAWFVMATLNNQAYTFGNHSASCSSSSSPPVYMFDGQSWVSRSSIVGLPFYNHAGVAIDTDRALICGGWAYKGSSCRYVSDCFIYSASSDSWKPAASMAQIRADHSMVMFEGETFECSTSKIIL